MVGDEKEAEVIIDAAAGVLAGLSMALSGKVVFQCTPVEYTAWVGFYKDILMPLTQIEGKGSVLTPNPTAHFTPPQQEP